MATLATWIRRDRKRNLAKFRECFDNATKDGIVPDGSAGGYAPGRLGSSDLSLKKIAKTSE